MLLGAFRKTADNADAGVSRLRSSSLSSLRSDLLRSRFGAAEIDETILFGNAQAAAKQVLPKAKQRRVARAVCKTEGFATRASALSVVFHNLSKTSDTFSLNVFTGVERE